jgi:hypothetical protein
LASTALVVAAALVLSTATRAQETVAPFCFTGLSQDVRVVVDAQAARHRGGEKFIPLMVYVGSWGAKVLRIEARSFSLRAPGGAVSSLAPRDQIQDRAAYGYFKVADDYTFLRNNLDRGPVRMAFNGLGFMTGTCFFPNVGGAPALIRDDVDLIPYAFTRALLYYPNPEGKANGIYILTYQDARNGVEVQVPFRIEWDRTGDFPK